MLGSTLQITCPQCRHQAWVTAGSTTRCTQCGAPLATYIAQASVGSGVPNVPMPSVGGVVGAMQRRMLAKAMTGGQPSRRGILTVVIGGIVLAIVGGAVAITLKSKLGLNTAKGNLAYAALGIDAERADPDLMRTSVGGPAQRWARDAVWWSESLQALRADGTMDLRSGGATVTYVSPSRVSSYAASVRKDSIKGFAFGPAGVGWGQIYGALKRWENVQPPAAPGCTIKQLATVLAPLGLTGDKTVRVVFDPRFARMGGAPEVDSWHVTGDDPKLDAWFSLADCARTK
ncbi:MAG TPA: hypothetical protein VGM88_11895 [Kofleriaceae bacterium]|jgi:hypothetical protein